MIERQNDRMTDIDKRTSKDSKSERMGDLSDAIQRQPVLSVKVTVLDLIKEGVHPIQPHGTERQRHGQERVLDQCWETGLCQIMI